MSPSELLERMAENFKTEVGPAIEADYPRTQAFLSAVVLQKLAMQLRLQQGHSELERRDRETLQQDLVQLLADIEAPPSLSDAASTLIEDGDGGLCHIIEALYAARETLGEAAFEALLGRVRQTMRRSLDRRMEYAS